LLEIDAEIDVDNSLIVSALANTDASTLVKITAPRTETEPGDADCDAETGVAIGTLLGDAPSMHVVDKDTSFETAPAFATFPEGHVTVPEQVEVFKPELDPKYPDGHRVHDEPVKFEEF
jgi:hypothetical protein